jgi:hypothetical protein
MHPPISFTQRIGLKKEKELVKKAQPPSNSQAALTANLTSAGGTNIMLNVNLSEGVQQQQDTPLRESINGEFRYRSLITPAARAMTPLQPSLTPSSPILQTRDKDARLSKFIRS